MKYTRGIKTRTADAIEQGISIHVSSHNKNDKMGWIGVAYRLNVIEQKFTQR